MAHQCPWPARFVAKLRNYQLAAADHQVAITCWVVVVADCATRVAVCRAALLQT